MSNVADLDANGMVTITDADGTPIAWMPAQVFADIREAVSEPLRPGDYLFLSGDSVPFVGLDRSQDRGDRGALVAALEAALEAETRSAMARLRHALNAIWWPRTGP